MLVAVEGVDDTLYRRRSDLSQTGIYFETESQIGEVGSMQWLHLSSIDAGETLQLMARVVRVVCLDDIRRDTAAYGVALEFMPESQGKIERLDRLLGRIISQQYASQTLQRNDGIRPPTASLVLETSVPVTAGDKVRLEVSARRLGKRTIAFAGTVAAPSRSALGGWNAQVNLQLQPSPLPAEGGGTDSIARAVDLLLDDLSADRADRHPAKTSEPAPRSRRHKHLVGALSRIALPSLLCLFDMEQMSGELRLRSQDDQGRVFIDRGQVIDAELAADDLPARDVIGRLIGWTDGEFEFALGQVDRPRKIALSTTALLIDLARDKDEKNR